MKRTQRPVAAEPVEHRGAQRDPGHKRDRERGVRAEAANSREHPEELVGGHWENPHACACAAQYAVARPGPSSSAVLATTSASQPLAATTETSSNPLAEGSPVRGSMRWCISPHLRLRTLLVAAPWSRSITVAPPIPTGHPSPAGPDPIPRRAPPILPSHAGPTSIPRRPPPH